MTKSNRNRGFTIVEITIVMAFIALLLLAVLFVTVYAGQMYAKGMTLKNLNQTGRSIVDMVRRDFAAASPTTIRAVSTGSGTAKTGRLCLGTVSYVWNNSSLLLSASSVPKLRVVGSALPVHLVRVQDADMKYCTPNISGAYPMTIASTETYSELLTGSDTDFAVYAVTATPYYSTAADEGAVVTQGLFRVTMTIGTNEANTVVTNATTQTVSCKPPTDNAANFDFCSVRDFDIITRTGGGIL